MSDNKQNTGMQDDIQVDLHDPSEVEYLHQQYPQYTHEQIKAVIKQHGPFRKDIIVYLSKSH